MKRPFVGAMLFTLCTLPGYAQYSCSPSALSGLNGGIISFDASADLAGIIQSAIDQWSNSCPGAAGQSFPILALNNYQATQHVPVYYHDFEGLRCGATTWFAPFPGSAPQPIAIDLYETSGGYSCQPISDTLAHEIGHVLGLGDAPNPDTSCHGEIMGGRAPGETRSVMSGDCATADNNWTTPAERDRKPPGDDRNPGNNEGGCGDDCSPIIINFENGDYRLTGANSPVRFAMNPQREPVLMGWTAAGADEAFLWLDRNHNGRVTSGAELFGNFTPLRNGDFAKNGFEALREFDDNHDGVIDENDAIWSELLLWRDLNHNGVSEPDEITPLSASDLTAIDLHDHWTGRSDTQGNSFRYESLVSIRSHSGHTVRKQPVYDIFFVALSY